jgi:hypothetical protein
MNRKKLEYLALLLGIVASGLIIVEKFKSRKNAD